MIKKFSEIDKKALNEELNVIINDCNLYSNKVIDNQKVFLEKLNNKKLDEVIHELFIKDDILNLIASSQLSCKTPVLKLDLLASLKEFNIKLISEMLDKIEDLWSDTPELEQINLKIHKVSEKYKVMITQKDNSQSGGNTDIEKYIEDYIELHTYKYSTKCITDSNLKSSFDLKYALGDEIIITLSGSIDAKDMQAWMNDHFLVKDLNNSMAILEVVY